MIHAVYLEDGKARYANRWVRTEGFEAERKAGRSLYGGLMAGPPFKNAANTAIIPYDGKLLALWEGGAPHAVNARLETWAPMTSAGRSRRRSPRPQV